jgi:hypothetical protein
MTMFVKIPVLAAYFGIVLAIGLAARTHWRSKPEYYLLADRKLGTLVLLGVGNHPAFGAKRAGLDRVFVPLSALQTLRMVFLVHAEKG